MKTFEITFNGIETFQLQFKSVTACINELKSILVSNEMEDDSYLISEVKEDVEVEVRAIVSRRRRNNGRVSVFVEKF